MKYWMYITSNVSSSQIYCYVGVLSQCKHHHFTIQTKCVCWYNATSLVPWHKICYFKYCTLWWLFFSAQDLYPRGECYVNENFNYIIYKLRKLQHSWFFKKLPRILAEYLAFVIGLDGDWTPIISTKLYNPHSWFMLLFNIKPQIYMLMWNMYFLNWVLEMFHPYFVRVAGVCQDPQWITNKNAIPVMQGLNTFIMGCLVSRGKYCR